MLQTLSRVYWMTSDQKYLDWAIKIADHYLLEIDLSNVEYLKLRDHGCEIIGGLSELYMTLHLLSHDKKYEYQPHLYRLLDRILTFGRNQDGYFYNSINLKANQVIDNRIADTWGYTLNAFYTVWMTDKKSEYIKAVLKPFKSLNNSYRNFEWEPKISLGHWVAKTVTLMLLKAGLIYIIGGRILSLKLGLILRFKYFLECKKTLVLLKGGMEMGILQEPL